MCTPYISNNSKCKLGLCSVVNCDNIISKAVKVDDRSHIVSVAWWVSRLQMSKMGENIICWMGQIHKITPPHAGALSAKMWICSIFSDIQGHWWAQGLIINFNISHTQRHTCPAVQLRPSVIYCTLLLPVLYSSLRVFTGGTSRFNSLHIEETGNKGGAWGVRQ